MSIADVNEAFIERGIISMIPTSEGRQLSWNFMFKNFLLFLWLSKFTSTLPNLHFLWKKIITSKRFLRLIGQNSLLLQQLFVVVPLWMEEEENEDDWEKKQLLFNWNVKFKSR